eukprot:2942635-Amphidinium_carterae.1
MRLVEDESLAWTQAEFWSAMGVRYLPLGAFLLHCPRQRLRPYTIASSPVATPGSATAALLKVHKPLCRLNEPTACLLGPCCSSPSGDWCHCLSGVHSLQWSRHQPPRMSLKRADDKWICHNVHQPQRPHFCTLTNSKQ